MPSATDELREKMNEYFGDPIDDAGPHKYLIDQGYTCSRRWDWSKEGVNSYEDMTEKEYNCLAFLVQEWDYGGLEQ